MKAVLTAAFSVSDRDRMRPVVTRNGKALAIAPDIQVTLRQAEFQPEPAVRSALADDWRVRNDPESLIDELG